MFYYHKQKYKINNDYQINNLLLIVRNQILNIPFNHCQNNHNINVTNKKNSNNKKSNPYKYIRKQYSTPYSYMSINLNTLFFTSLVIN